MNPSALAANCVLTASVVQINLSGNMLCGVDAFGGIYSTEGIKAVADAICVNRHLAVADVRFNLLRESDKQMMRVRAGFDMHGRREAGGKETQRLLLEATDALEKREDADIQQLRQEAGQLRQDAAEAVATAMLGKQEAENSGRQKVALHAIPEGATVGGGAANDKRKSVAFDAIPEGRPTDSLADMFKRGEKFEAEVRGAVAGGGGVDAPHMRTTPYLEVAVLRGGSQSHRLSVRICSLPAFAAQSQGCGRRSTASSGRGKKCT